MATYTWTVERMEVQPSMSGHVDVVVSACWHCLAEDGPTVTDAYGCQAMGPVKPEFTEYALLTQALVLSWVWQEGVDQAAVEAMLAARIIELQDAPVILPNPW